MADGVSLELEDGFRVAWGDPDGLRASLAAPEPAAEWHAEGELGDGHSALRVFTGATGAGTLLLLAGARPAQAPGHDGEAFQAVLIAPSGEVTAIGEALLSTQYGANGQVERVGLELYAVDDDYPIRGAGDVRSTTASDEEAGRRERTTLDFRLDGEPGVAILDIVGT